VKARNGWLLWIGAIAIVAIVVAAYVQRAPSRSAGPGGLAGQAAPAFPLRDTSGKSVALNAYRGHVVVMNLWATWCPPCRAEMPDLQRLSDAYAARGLVVLGVNQGESAQRASEFARALRIQFPILLDAEQQYGRTFTALGLPTTVVIDRSGVIARGYDGALSYPQMVDAVAPLLRAR
jgi:peroxiredoxin